MTRSMRTRLMKIWFAGVVSLLSGLYLERVLWSLLPMLW
jgi:hypothetical protein